jgi:CubicO group peptidase (beta-lactamase class C family)
MQKFRIILFFMLTILISCNWSKNNANSALEEPVEPILKPTLPLEKIHKIDSLISKYLIQRHYNGNVLVAYKGYPISRKTLGYRNLATKERLDFNTAFQLASVSKSFTAMAVLILKERGKLSLDDLVQKYMPDFPFNNVTIKHLLQHTSGMPNYMFFVDNSWKDDMPLTNEDVLKILNINKPTLSFEPGKRHIYSNTGYAMLALLVERISGQPFYKFLDENIFIPLRMKHTFAWNKAAIDTIHNVANGYSRPGFKYRSIEHVPLDEVLGDKSIYSTIDDLLKYEQAWHNYKLISKNSTIEAFTPVVTNSKRIQKYGYGWRLTDFEGRKVIYHNGLWNGFTSSLTRYVDDSLTVILINNTNAHVGPMVKEIYAIIENEINTTDSKQIVRSGGKNK